MLFLLQRLHLPILSVAWLQLLLVFCSHLISYDTGGIIKVKEIYGLITTDIEAQATGCVVDFTATRAGATQTDLCATADLDAKTDGTMLRITGDFSDALVVGADGDDLVEATGVLNGVLLGPGTVQVTYGAASTGAITWYMAYESLGGSVA